MFEKKSLPKISEQILYPRISKETFPSKKIGKRNFYSKNVWRHFKQNLFDDDMYFTKNSLKRNPFQTNFNRTCIKKILDETCLPQTLWREICTKQFSKETAAKNDKSTTSTWWDISTKKYLKVKLCQLLPKYIWRKILHRTICEGNSQPNKLSIKVFSKQISKETSTKEYLRKHAYQT